MRKTIEISRRIALIIVFAGVLTCKILGFNSVVDDALLLVIGAIIGKEVIEVAKEKSS